MFEIQPSIRHLAAGPDQVISISNSVNHPLVVVPGRSSQMAEAFVVALREVGDLVVVFVCLWLDLDREQVVYASAPIEEDELDAVQEEALAFCESMGFIMEETPFADLDRASQEDFLVRLPPFRAERAPISTSLVGEADEVTAVERTVTAVEAPTPRPGRDLRRLGRFLARF
jgi:hypothetical protein